MKTEFLVKYLADTNKLGDVDGKQFKTEVDAIAFVESMSSDAEWFTCQTCGAYCTSDVYDSYNSVTSGRAICHGCGAK